MIWPLVKFSDAFDTAPKIKLERGEIYTFVPMEDVNPEHKFVNAVKERVYTGGGAKFQNGDTIFARITPCLEHGKIAKISNLKTKVGFGSTEYLVFRAKEKKSDPDFLYYLSKSSVVKEPAIKSMVGSSGRQRARLEVIENLEIPIPPLPTQQRIAEVLSAYDDLIENNRRRIKLLEQAAKLLYREWFVHLRFPGHDTTSITNGLPQGWEKGTVSDFYKTSSGGTPSRANPDFYTGEINWVKTQELQNSYLFQTDERITEEAIQQSSAKLFPENTVLIAMYGATIGQLAILGEVASCNQACCAILPKHKNSNYVYAFLFFLENKPGLINLGQGAAQKNISQDLIKNYEMTLPDAEIMDTFVSKVEPMLTQIKILAKQNKKLAEARDILLPRLMNGEVAV